MFSEDVVGLVEEMWFWGWKIMSWVNSSMACVWAMFGRLCLLTLLTAALDQLRIVASSTSNDPGLRSGQHQQTGRCLLQSCCYQVLRGRPGERFQSAAGGVPVWASIDSCTAFEAGVFCGRRQMWPNNEWRQSAIRDGRSSSFILSLTTALGTLSYHLIPRIRRSPAYEKTGSCHCLLCALSTFQSHITLPTAQERCISWAWTRD